jgi:hypothetical protein
MMRYRGATHQAPKEKKRHRRRNRKKRGGATDSLIASEIPAPLTEPEAPEVTQKQGEIAE